MHSTGNLAFSASLTPTSKGSSVTEPAASSGLATRKAGTHSRYREDDGRSEP